MSFNRKHVVIDGDVLKFAIASKGEKRTVHIAHKETGDEYIVDTRTSFYGHWKKKSGGLLAEMNADLPEEKRMLPEDFTYTDIQTPEPLSHVLHTAKLYTDNYIKSCEADSYSMLIGKGDSWRVDYSTLLKYKGNRTDLIRPLLMDDVIDYMVRKFGAELVYDFEVDDRIVMDTYGKDGHFAAGVEKDLYSSSLYFLDTSRPELGVQNGNQFGKLWINDKKEVKGIGRKHLLWQVCSKDDSDNYSAYAFSDVSWGPKSAYEALVNCQNDRELFQAAYDVFKKLYPEPKTVTGWRGDSVQIDPLYVMQECFTMAKMLRWEDDIVDLKDVFNKLGVDYGN